MPIQRRLNRAYRDEEERSDRLTGEADERRSEFDARGYARDFTDAAFADFREDFGENMDDLRGSQVGRGRINSGFGFEEEDRLFRDMGRDLNRELGRAAFTSAGLDLRNTEGMTATAEGSRGRYLDLLAGERDAGIARENAKRQERGGLFGALGSVAGSIFGGPIGGSIGGAIGKLF